MEIVEPVGDRLQDGLTAAIQEVFAPVVETIDQARQPGHLFPNHVLARLDDATASSIALDPAMPIRIVTHERGRPYEIPVEMVSALRGQGAAAGAELRVKIQSLSPEYRVQFFLDEVTRYHQGIPFRATPAKDATQRDHSHV